jgi:hypothetical protein
MWKEVRDSYLRRDLMLFHACARRADFSAMVNRVCSLRFSGKRDSFKPDFRQAVLDHTQSKGSGAR